MARKSSVTNVDGQGNGPDSPGQPTYLLALGVAVLMATAVAFHFTGEAILRRMEASFLRERIQAGRHLLDHLAQGAVLPLLGEDDAVLGGLVRKPPEGGAFLSASVVDDHNVIRAHTDPARVGDRFSLPVPFTDLGSEGGIALLSYPLRSGGSALHFSRPLALRDKVVGSAHIVFSREAIARDAKAAAALFHRSLIGLGGIAAVGIACLTLLYAFGRISSARVTAALGWGSEEGDTAYRLRSIVSAPADGGTIPPERVPDPAEKPAPSPEPRVVRNQATVLVSNIRGFRKYADSRQPEEILEGLNSYFRIAERIVTSHGGQVSNYSGDTVVAVFGGSEFLPDHTRLAVQAALAMQTALREEGGEGGNPLLRQVAIGIGSGVVLSCEVAASHRAGPVMIGESFKSADALAMRAGPGEIVIGREVYQNLGRAVSVDPLPPREILDRTGSWENFRLQDDVRRGA